MTQAEQREFDQLKEQLSKAQTSAEEGKVSFTRMLDGLREEVRLYRGLFWCMLAVSLVAAILSFLQR